MTHLLAQLFLSSPTDKKQIPLAEFPVTIGATIDCPIALTEVYPEIGNSYIVIEEEENHLLLLNPEKSPVFRHNGDSFQQVILNVGDTIEIGSISITVEEVLHSSPPAPLSPQAISQLVSKIEKQLHQSTPQNNFFSFSREEISSFKEKKEQPPVVDTATVLQPFVKSEASYPKQIGPSDENEWSEVDKEIEDAMQEAIYSSKEKRNPMPLSSFFSDPSTTASSQQPHTVLHKKKNYFLFSALLTVFILTSILNSLFFISKNSAQRDFIAQMRSLSDFSTLLMFDYMNGTASHSFHQTVSSNALFFSPSTVIPPISAQKEIFDRENGFQTQILQDNKQFIIVSSPKPSWKHWARKTSTIVVYSEDMELRLADPNFGQKILSLFSQPNSDATILEKIQKKSSYSIRHLENSPHPLGFYIPSLNSSKAADLSYGQKVFNAPRYYPLYQEYLQILSYGQKAYSPNEQNLQPYKAFFDKWLQKFPNSIFYLHGESDLISNGYRALHSYPKLLLGHVYLDAKKSMLLKSELIANQFLEDSSSPALGGLFTSKKLATRHKKIEKMQQDRALHLKKIGEKISHLIEKNNETPQPHFDQTLEKLLSQYQTKNLETMATIQKAIDVAASDLQISAEEFEHFLVFSHLQPYTTEKKPSSPSTSFSPQFLSLLQQIHNSQSLQELEMILDLFYHATHLSLDHSTEKNVLEQELKKVSMDRLKTLLSSPPSLDSTISTLKPGFYLVERILHKIPLLSDEQTLKVLRQYDTGVSLDSKKQEFVVEK